MLSRDAEHLYWLSRYVERVENTARLINVNSELMLDFPGDKTLGCLLYTSPSPRD